MNSEGIFLDSIIRNINPNNSIDSDEKLKHNDINNLKKHNEYYNAFLGKYIDNLTKKYSNQRKMKWTFLIVVLFLLCFIVISTFVAICITVAIGNYDLYTLSGVVTSVVGAITSFLVLPRIIAINLFPKSEEDKTDEIFKTMFSHDDTIRERYYKNNK